MVYWLFLVIDDQIILIIVRLFIKCFVKQNIYCVFIKDNSSNMLKYKIFCMKKNHFKKILNYNPPTFLSTNIS